MKPVSRRAFMGSAVTGAAMLSSIVPTPAAPEKRIRLGAMAVGDFSFWPYSWGDILSKKEPVNRGTLGTSVLSMDVTQVWDINTAVARSFAEKIGAETVDTYDGMIGKVDAVACGGYYEAPWQHLLLKPYIDSGIPVYVSRPFAYSLRDIDTLLDCAAKHGTPLLATDVYEHLYAVGNARTKLASLGQLYGIHSTCLTNDYPARFHTHYMIPAIAGYDIESVSLLTDNPNDSAYVSETFLFKGTSERAPFTATSTMTPTGDLFTMTINGEKGTFSLSLPQLSDWRDDLAIHHLPLLIAMQKTFEGDVYESFDTIRKKTELFLTGFYSAVEKRGAPVKVGSLPVDWRVRPIRPGHLASIGFK